MKATSESFWIAAMNVVDGRWSSVEMLDGE